MTFLTNLASNPSSISPHRKNEFSKVDPLLFTEDYLEMKVNLKPFTDYGLWRCVLKLSRKIRCGATVIDFKLVRVRLASLDLFVSLALISLAVCLVSLGVV